METVYVRSNDKYLRTAIDEILYLEAAGSYLKLVTIRGEYSLSQNLSQFMRKNPISALQRVHRSFVVNLKKVDSFDSQFIYISEFKIPMGQTHKVNFMTRIHCL
ncbi:MAG: LytTR family DNA-binding domain-containing protein [Cyclobacteriaceae bacterium]